MLEKKEIMTDEIHRALESAVTASVDDMEKIKGRTLIAVDVSGSMSARISAKSDIRYSDIASLLVAMETSFVKIQRYAPLKHRRLSIENTTDGAE